MPRFVVSRQIKDGPCHAQLAKWPNGLRCLVHKDRQPITVTQFHFINGAYHYRYGWSGLPHFCEHLIFTSTGKLAQAALARQIDSLGKVDGYSDTEMVGVGCTGLGTAWRRSLSLFHRVLTDYGNGKIDRRAIGWQRLRVAREIREDRNLDGIAESAFYEALWPNSVCKQSVLGSLRQLHKYQFSDIVACFNLFLNGKRMCIGVSGDVPPRDVFQQVDKYFGDMEAGEPITVTRPPLIRNSGIKLVRRSGETHTGVMFGQHLLKRTPGKCEYDKNYVIALLNIILGDLWSSEPFLRSCRSGACYALTARIDTYGSSEVFLVDANCDREKINRLVEDHLATLRRISRSGVTEAEFNLAMNKALYSEAYTMSSPKKRLYQSLEYLAEHGEYSTYRSRRSKYRKVAPEDLQTYLRDHVDWKRFTLVVAGATDGYEPSARIRWACGA